MAISPAPSMKTKPKTNPPPEKKELKVSILISMKKPTKKNTPQEEKYKQASGLRENVPSLFSVSFNNEECESSSMALNRKRKASVSKELVLYDGNRNKNREGSVSSVFLGPKLTQEEIKIAERIKRFSVYSSEEEEEEEERRLGISTKLQLFDDPWKIKKRLIESDCNKNKNREGSVSSVFLGPKLTQEQIRIAERIKSFSIYTSEEEEEEERRLGISTKLQLFDDPWKIKKSLTESDCNQLCRLMLGRETVMNNIIAFWDEDRIERIGSQDGMSVRVWDYDTETEYQLTFKRWGSNDCYVFGGNWKKDFVGRKKLQTHDEIGMFWDVSNLRFGFRVLVWAPKMIKPLPPSEDV